MFYSRALTDATDMDEWASANVPASLAQHDYISGTQDNRDVVLQAITAFSKKQPAFFDMTQCV